MASPVRIAIHPAMVRLSVRVAIRFVPGAGRESVAEWHEPPGRKLVSLQAPEGLRLAATLGLAAASYSPSRSLNDFFSRFAT